METTLRRYTSFQSDYLELFGDDCDCNFFYIKFNYQFPWQLKIIKLLKIHRPHPLGANPPPANPSPKGHAAPGNCSIATGNRDGHKIPE